MKGIEANSGGNLLSRFMAVFLLIAVGKVSWESKILVQNDFKTSRSLQVDFVKQQPAVVDESATTERLPSYTESDNKQPDEYGGSESMLSTLRFGHQRPQKSNQKDLVVFYHIFIPDNKSVLLPIVREQLTQIGKSTAFQATSGNTYVYYNTVGNSTTSTEEETFIGQLCTAQNLTCVHTNHFQQGLEFLTLRDVHKYCQRSENLYNNVIYMHNKGSFHTEKKGSVHLRRSMMTAVTSSECQAALDADKCNICGLCFSPMRSPFYPGNFWTAQCQYIKRLLNPFRFRDMADVNRKRVLQMKNRGKLTLTLFNERPYTMGTGRYAAEFWAGSHPTVRPCDVTSVKKYTLWQTRDFRSDQIDIQLAPRERFIAAEEKLNASVPDTTLGRLREYFLAAGHIIRWQRYYHEVAPGDSWFWKYFPEGDTWKKALEKHGNNAVSQMLNFGTY